MKNMQKSFEWDTLSGRMRYLMKELNMKQKDFAKECGVSDNYVSMLVTGKRTGISEPLCRLICQTYCVNPAWLRDGEGEPFADAETVTADRLREVLSLKIEGLDSAQLQRLLDMVK